MYVPPAVDKDGFIQCGRRLHCQTGEVGQNGYADRTNNRCLSFLSGNGELGP